MTEHGTGWIGQQSIARRMPHLASPGAPSAMAWIDWRTNGRISGLMFVQWTPGRTSATGAPDLVATHAASRRGRFG